MVISLAALLLGGCSATNTAQDTRHFPRDGMDVWNAAHDVAREEPRWDEIAACPARGTLVYECRSALWGFVDDFAVSVDPDPRGGSVVHLDSRSRVGRSDWGVNAKRIARFLDHVECKLAERPEKPTPANVASVGSGSH